MISNQNIRKGKRFLLKLSFEHYLITCECTKFEMFALNLISNIKVYYMNRHYRRRESRTVVNQSYEMILKVDFDFFSHLCRYGSLPKEFKVNLI